MKTKEIINKLLEMGITREEIAFRCKCSTRTVERWLKGKFNPHRADKIYLENWYKRRMKGDES